MKLYLYSMLAFTISLYGVVPTITRLQFSHKVENEGGVQLPENVYLAHDFHFDYQGCALSSKQKNDLIEAAKALDAYVIGESTFDYTGLNTAIKDRLMHIQNVATNQHSKPSDEKTIIVSPAILSADFICECKKKDIPCDNVEFRQAVDASLNNIAITAHEIRDFFYEQMRLIEEQVNEVCRDDAFKNFQEYALNVLARVKSNAQALMDYFKDKNVTLHELQDNKEFQQFKDQLYLFDLELIDLKIIIAILSNKQQKNIIVFAGNHHANNVGQFLVNNLNYNSTHNAQENYSGAAYDTVLNNCIDVQEYFASIVDNEPRSDGASTQEQSLWNEFKNMINSMLNYFN